MVGGRHDRVHDRHAAHPAAARSTGTPRDGSWPSAVDYRSGGDRRRHAGGLGVRLPRAQHRGRDRRAAVHAHGAGDLGDAALRTVGCTVRHTRSRRGRCGDAGGQFRVRSRSGGHRAAAHGGAGVHHRARHGVARACHGAARAARDGHAECPHGRGAAGQRTALAAKSENGGHRSARRWRGARFQQRARGRPHAARGVASRARHAARGARAHRGRGEFRATRRAAHASTAGVQPPAGDATAGARSQHPRAFTRPAAATGVAEYPHAHRVVPSRRARGARGRRDDRAGAAQPRAQRPRRPGQRRRDCHHDVGARAPDR